MSSETPWERHVLWIWEICSHVCEVLGRSVILLEIGFLSGQVFVHGGIGQSKVKRPAFDEETGVPEI